MPSLELSIGMATLTNWMLMLKIQLVMSAIADLLVSQEMEMEPFGILTVKGI